MKQITRWSPDTCGCVLEYSWDDSVSQEERVHTPHSIVKACSIHMPAGASIHGDDTIKSIHDTVLSENQTKNYFLKTALEKLPKLRKPAKAGQGADAHELHEDVKYTWRFDEDRNLIASFDGIELTETEKQEILIDSDKIAGSRGISLK